MTTARNVSFVLAGIALGFGVGTTASPEAVAQAPTTALAAPAARWQQYCEELRGSSAELNQLLAQRGAEGWELAAMPFTFYGSGFTGAVCFKRPAPSGRFAPSRL